jgi:hypothetical protein
MAYWELRRLRITDGGFRVIINNDQDPYVIICFQYVILYSKQVAAMKKYREEGEI